MDNTTKNTPQIIIQKHQELIYTAYKNYNRIFSQRKMNLDQPGRHFSSRRKNYNFKGTVKDFLTHVIQRVKISKNLSYFIINTKIT